LRKEDAMSRFTAPLVVTPLDDGKRWVVLSDGFSWGVGSEDSEDRVDVPLGMETDFATVPRAIWWLIPRWGKHGNAAVLHDCGYWKQDRSREEYDAIFLEAMKALGVGKLQRTVMYKAVKWFGGRAWESNALRAAENPAWRMHDPERVEALRASLCKPEPQEVELREQAKALA
jgi:hypothetical protein